MSTSCLYHVKKTYSKTMYDSQINEQFNLLTLPQLYTSTIQCISSSSQILQIASKQVRFHRKRFINCMNSIHHAHQQHTNIKFKLQVILGVFYKLLMKRKIRETSFLQRKSTVRYTLPCLNFALLPINKWGWVFEKVLHDTISDQICSICRNVITPA